MNYTPGGAETIAETARRMVALAIGHNTTVTARFNGVAMSVTPNDRPEEVVSAFYEVLDRERRAYASLRQVLHAAGEGAERRTDTRSEPTAGTARCDPASTASRATGTVTDSGSGAAEPNGAVAFDCAEPLVSHAARTTAGDAPETEAASSGVAFDGREPASHEDAASDSPHPGDDAVSAHS